MFCQITKKLLATPFKLYIILYTFITDKPQANLAQLVWPFGFKITEPCEGIDLHQSGAGVRFPAGPCFFSIIKCLFTPHGDFNIFQILLTLTF